MDMPPMTPLGHTPQPISSNKPGLIIKKIWYKERKIILIAAAAIIAVIMIAAGSFFIWYTQAIQAVNNEPNKYVIVTIEQGMSPTQIGQLLEKDKVVRSAAAFVWYARFTHTGGSLQSGTYQLSPSESVASIVEHLTKGEVNSFRLTFLPGATLAENKQVFLDAGYTQVEVDTAFAKNDYTGVVFTDKPTSANLEGYIFGDTYAFNTGTPVETILQSIFDHFSMIITSNKLIAAYKTQGLNLYEAITLASIIQREVTSINNSVASADQKQVAQVFYSRLALGMTLGSDVTFQYAAKLLGVQATPDLDSPYNTRKYAGLPPGPIATPSKAALFATASPAQGDYLYFLSGDDDITYFARTNAEHEANIVNHCQKKCSL